MRFVGFILAFLLVGFSLSKEVSFTQEDRDRLIRVETKVDIGFQQVDKRFEQIEKRIDSLITFMWILAGAFVGITGVTIGFALWNRKATERPRTQRGFKGTWNTLEG
ncbi:MAG: hypothetical protein RMI51_05515 [Aquificaceae bacterium]|nr:hypothetical protein [Aquificaceae bacterium]